MSGKSMEKSVKGFTLVEILAVLLLISILAAIATPVVINSITRSKEAALLENMRTMRELLDDFYADHNEYPDSLNELVDLGYMREIPIHPFTERKDDWLIVEDNEGGVRDVFSKFDAVARNGSNYREW